MKRRTILTVSIIAVLFIIALIGCIYVLNRPASGHVALIYQNDELIECIDLDAVTESYSFEITNDTGDSNTITVRPGEIAVTKASCPDKVCVNMGFIHNDLLPITCLPNHLVIQIEGGENTDELDGVTR